MSRHRAIAVTDQQLALIMSAARTLPPVWRSRYLSGIADRLHDRDEASDAEIAQAVDGMLRAIGWAA